MIRVGVYLLLILLSLMMQVKGDCFVRRLKPPTSPDASGKQITEEYCEYKNETHPINSTWSLPYPDCVKCGCGTFGLSCCGYGVRAGIRVLPEDCQLAKGTCEVQLVKISDPSKPCFDLTPSTSQPASTKKKCSRKRKIQP